MKILLSYFVGAALYLAITPAVPATSETANLSIEKLIDIRHPSEPIWAPDGRHIAFVWDRAGVGNIYMADANGGRSSPVALTHFKDRPVADIFWSHDGKFVYFSRDGALWQVSNRGGVPRPVRNSEAAGLGFALSPEGGRIAFARPIVAGSRKGQQEGTDLYVRALAGGVETRLAHSDGAITAISWSADGARLAYTGGSVTIPHDETPEYSGSKIVYRTMERTPGQIFVVAATGGAPVAIEKSRGATVARWLGSNQIVFDCLSSDFKRRTIYVAGVGAAESRVAHEDVEKEFWSTPAAANAGSQPSPDGRWIAFLSDRDGWDHLYVMPSTGGEAIQITTGQYETWRPSWSHDSKRVAFDANEPGKLGDRRLGVADISNGPAKAKVTFIMSGRGTNTAPVWSPDDRRVVYQHTDTENSADLFAIDVAGGQPARLSDSMPPGIDRSALVPPQFVQFRGPDGKPVPGWLFVPKNLDRTKKHAAIIWIHGDGTNQNYDGWHIQRNYAVYYSFHQYLLQKDYVVFAPDYRGSIGYGRAWRNGVYMDVGGKDAQDAWWSVNYLKTLPYVDPGRIGIWGLSYGGFFTLIAMTDQPAMFRAGVDVAGPVDYAMYYTDPYHGAWTVSRMGTPDKNPQVYAKAAPIAHIDRLARPLLILHGTADVNVPYLESVRLIDEILRYGRGDLVSFMFYPGEFHYFTREQVLRDAWRRVDRFFESNLHPGQAK